jgi:Na+/glutamate symporter
VLKLFRPRQIEWKANIVVWLVTVAIFLGTLVGGVLILFLVSQRDLIREALRNPETKRMERRTVARVEVELLSTDEPLIHEITLTENVSRSGARVLTKTRWRPRFAWRCFCCRLAILLRGRLSGDVQ